jgi:tetratricopeptide (TPR) repeat protein
MSRVFAMETNSLAGDHRAALSLGTSAIAEASEMGAVGIMDVATRRYLGAAQVRAGAFEDARLNLDLALEAINSRDTSRHIEAECLMWLALAHLGLGNTEHTKTLLDEATEAAERQEMRFPLARIHIARGQLIAATRPEALEEANAALNAAHSLANELGCVVLLPEIELVRAELLERRGELQAAREAKQEALRLFQQQGARANAERLADQLDTSA